MSTPVIIHCKPSIEEFLINSDLMWSRNDNIDTPEIDVIVEDLDISDDEEFVNHYGIDYDQVNMIELL